MITGLDLFSGIGGISLALQPWVRTVQYVEIDSYCQAVLQTRMRAGDLETAPIWDDVTTFDPEPWAGQIDIISGGFPCQDISLAGLGAGLEGERSGLFFEIIRCAGIIRPGFIFLENVPAITSRGGRDVVGELAALGYDARWAMLSAYDVGAPHRRERWWCLAHTATPRQPYGESGQGRAIRDKARRAEFERRGTASDAESQRRGEGEPVGARSSEREGPTAGQRSHATIAGSDWWATEPDVGRVADGIPARVDRIRGLGNSVVPLCAREAFQRLSGLD